MFHKMKKLTIAWLLVCAGCPVAATCSAQQPPLNWGQPVAQIAPTRPSENSNSTITIPAGTMVPLTLATPISSRARRGDIVRAITAFPVTVGSQVAIPEGSYVEGVITKLDKSAPTVAIRFSRLLFASGYSVPIDGVSTPYVANLSRGNSTQFAGFFGGHVSPPDTFPGQTITPPPLPHSGPNMAALVALAIAGAVATIVMTILLMRHRGTSREILFDSGWQFDMVVQNPVTLDIASLPPPATN